MEKQKGNKRKVLKHQEMVKIKLLRVIKLIITPNQNGNLYLELKLNSIQTTPTILRKVYGVGKTRKLSICRLNYRNWDIQDERYVQVSCRWIESQHPNDFKSILFVVWSYIINSIYNLNGNIIRLYRLQLRITRK